MNKPKLVVFDLDYTLWPFWVDTDVDAPFTKHSNGNVYDRSNRHVQHYQDVPDILHKLKQEGATIAIASRTSYTKEAWDLVQLFGWHRYITYKEIYPGSKMHHFKRFKEQSGLDYSQMLFFDDEDRNIVEISGLGVTCIHVEDGMTLSLLHQGIETFAKNNS